MHPPPNGGGRKKEHVIADRYAPAGNGVSFLGGLQDYFHR